MTTAAAIASVIIGLVLATAGYIIWYQDDERGFAALLAVPGAALIYAGGDFLVRILL